MVSGVVWGGVGLGESLFGRLQIGTHILSWHLQRRHILRSLYAAIYSSLVIPIRLQRFWRPDLEINLAQVCWGWRAFGGLVVDLMVHVQGYEANMSPFARVHHDLFEAMTLSKEYVYKGN